jgi:hypothetical protein
MPNNSVTWTAKGRKHGAPPAPLLPIDVEESDKRVRRNPNDPPYGTPIDTPLAIELIRNLWKAIDDAELFKLKAQYKVLINQLTEKKGYDQDVQLKLEKLVDKNADWLEDLLKNSFAMTVDKSIVLKMLSQPGCEGIRFYLCLKKETANENKNVPGTLSLVSVGVDLEARDLNYEYDKTKHDLVNIPNIENCSLNAEYKFVLGTDPFDQSATNEKDIEPFVLFKYANHKYKYINK